MTKTGPILRGTGKIVLRYGLDMSVTLSPSLHKYVTSLFFMSYFHFYYSIKFTNVS